MQEKHLNDSLSQENSVTGAPRRAFPPKMDPPKNEQNRVSGVPPHAFPPKINVEIPGSKKVSGQKTCILEFREILIKLGLSGKKKVCPSYLFVSTLVYSIATF